MDECERLEELQYIVDELAERAAQGAVILVEGRRDIDSLNALGITRHHYHDFPEAVV